MVKQAKLFKSPADQQKYAQAAARYRLPYWDPIMPRNEISARDDPTTIWGLPKIFAQQTVFLKTPASPTKYVPTDNPLYSFKFPTDFAENKRVPLDQGEGFNPNVTIKCPDNDGKPDLNTLNLRIQRQANPMASRMWQLLAPSDLSKSTRTWNSFATKNARLGGDPSGSIESWHDNYHITIGSAANRGSDWTGQMGDPFVAGFEPMFWMHHNNIDRLLSLYQALYGKNVDNPTADLLVPFWKDDKSFFTSDDGSVKNYWAAGFGVPGTQNITGVQKIVQKYMLDTYWWAAAGPNNKTKPLANWPKDLSGSTPLFGDKARPTSSSTMMELTSVVMEDDQPTLVFRQGPIDQLTDSAASTDITLHTASLLENAALTNKVIIGNDVVLKPEVQKALLSQVWDAHIKVRKYAFNGSFSVHIFIGYVKDGQTERFATKKNEVNFFGIFASAQETAAGCEGCKQNREDDIVIEDTIPLTNYLMDYLVSNPKSEGLIAEGTIKKINSLEPAQVVPFLKEHLQWRMIDNANNLLSGREQEAQLEVTVTNRTFTPPSPENLMGVYGPITIYDEITRGQPGGRGYVYPPTQA